MTHGSIDAATVLDGRREPEQNGPLPMATRKTGEEMTVSLRVNGSRRSVPAAADTPLLYATLAPENATGNFIKIVQRVPARSAAV
jgi:hypothetical protein